MLIKSPAKINLVFQIQSRLPSGYHAVKAILTTVPLYDELNFELAANGESQISGTGQVVARPQDDLIYKAAQLLRQTTQTNLGFRCQVQKNIPSQSGLGGGSGNAAATLQALNELWQLNLDQVILLQLAQKLGSDVPFALVGGTQYESQHGDPDQEPKFQALPALPPAQLLLIKPLQINSQTGPAFDQLDALPPVQNPDYVANFLQLINSPQQPTWDQLASQLHNDFTRLSLTLHPLYLRLIDFLLAKNAFNATLTGSGSCLYSFFPPETNLQPLCQELNANFADLQLFPLHFP